MITYRLEEEKYMLVVNAACIALDLAALRQRLPQGTNIRDISNNTGKIDLQGPDSLTVLCALFPPEQSVDWHALPYYAFKKFMSSGYDVIVSRTGYTGELGYEIYLPAAETLKQWEALLGHPLVKPAGLGARDTLRLEAGLLLNGQDMDPGHTPAEAGYAGMLTSPADYVGKEGACLVRRKLVALTVPGRRSPRHEHKVFTAGGREVGVVTSGSFAPSLGYAIALAYIDKAEAEAEKYLIQAERATLEAMRVNLPFYKDGTARKIPH
jgi:aminomethyltransferase